MKKKEEDLIKLKIAWLEVYKAWLNLDPVEKQIFPLPQEPKIVKGKLII